MRILSLLAAPLFLLSTTSKAHAAPDYIVEPISSYLHTTIATAVNETGEASVSGLGQGISLPFGFDDGGLFDIPLLPGYSSALAMGINNDRVIVGYGTQNAAGEYAPRAFRFDSAQGILAALPSPLELPGSGAFAINHHGIIAGVVGDSFFTTEVRPALWVNGVVKVYPWLGVAFAINNRGNFAGSMYHSRNGPETAVLVQNGKRRDLGILSSFTASRALGINDCDDVVGYATDSAQRIEAFVKLADGPLKPVGGGDHLARDINNRRQIISSSSEVTVTDPDGTRTLLRNRSVNGEDWYQLFDAFSINDQGVVVGVGFHYEEGGPLPFVARGFIAHPLNSDSLPPLVCKP